MDARDLDKTPASNPFARIGEPEAGSHDNRNAFLHTADEDFPFRGTSLAVHLLRWFSVALGAATVLLVAALTRELLPDRPILALGAAAFVAFLPQFLFISSAVSNDNIAVLFVTASLWQLARAVRTGLTLNRVVVLGLIVGFSALTKLSGLGMVALALFVLLWLTLKKRDRQAGFVSTAWFVGIVAVVAGWWYARNLLLYDDPFAVAPMAALMGERAVPLSLWRWLSAESEGLRVSTWGLFGWFNILASPAFYLFFDGLAALGLLGVLVTLVRRRRLPLSLLALALWCVYTVLTLWRFSSVTIASQGRLLFPALPAYAIIWFWGILALFPARLQSWVSGAILSVQFVVAAAVPLAFIAPAYTPAILASSDLPQTVNRLDWRFEDGSEWLGISVDRTEIQPGDSLAVTLYHRVGAQSNGLAAIYIHVVSSAETIVAQRDSLPGSGNLARPAPPGILVDSYKVVVPITAPAPDTWRIQAGMYDLASGKRLAITRGASPAQKDGSTVALLRARPAGEPWGFDFDGRATLDGAEFDQVVSRSGSVRMKLHWRNASRSLRVFAHILGKDDRLWAAADGELSPEMQLELKLDPNIPPGVYPVELGLYPAPDGDRLSIFDRRGQRVGDRLLLGPVRVD